MAVHFVHVRKTGGTAIKGALRRAGLPATPYGPIELHPHDFRLLHVPREDYVFFCVRDPIARFMSGFYSRLHKGQPRYYFEWSPSERIVFETFPTPQRLAAALASTDREERERAQWSMTRVRHLRLIERSLGRPRHIWRRRRRVIYIARQETLEADWPQLRSLLGLPDDVVLPRGDKRAHRRAGEFDTSLDPVAERALRDWYARDYRLLAYCDKVRAKRGWGVRA